MKSNLKLWYITLLAHFLILIVIGYIAFWDQGFNDYQQKVEGYLQDIQKVRETQVSEKAQTLIIEIMKADYEAANGLQDLASQSFNIVLGAFLAFLSASTVYFFNDK